MQYATATIPLLITGNSESERQEQANSLINHYTKSPYDIHHVYRDETKKSIGIAQIKSLTKQLVLTPVIGKIKAGIIHELQYATTEAQNALLKLLEEPDETTMLIITASRKEELLPTVVSRCQVMQLENRHEYEVTTDQTEELEKLLTASDGQRLSYAEKILEEGQVPEQIKTFLTILRQKLVILARDSQSTIPVTIRQLISVIRKFDRARITLEKTNTNQRLLVENLLLEIPKNLI